jgi:hypothetical protein
MTHVTTLRPGLLGSDQNCWVIFEKHEWVGFGKRRSALATSTKRRESTACGDERLGPFLWTQVAHF